MSCAAVTYSVVASGGNAIGEKLKLSGELVVLNPSRIFSLVDMLERVCYELGSF
jgi:hypothetical protein